MNATYSNQENLTDWDLIVACLSPTKGTITIHTAADRQARLLCDGMGKLSVADLPADLYPLYDWSHVRDSSEAAVTECAKFLRQYLRLSDLALKANDALSRGDTATYNEALEALKAS